MSERHLRQPAFQANSHSGISKKSTEKDARFSVLARFIIYLMAAVVVIVGTGPIPAIIVAMSIVGLVFATGHTSLAKGMIGFLLFLFAAYALFFIFDVHIFILSPRTILEHRT
ncbi:MAG: hypothetical protein IJV62_04900, partial [Eggerthellaceae bacterium]|nr:hypothetical protein [Eggerthellaceae bacterium]